MIGILDPLVENRNTFSCLLPTVIDKETWEKRLACIIELFSRLRDGYLEGR